MTLGTARRRRATPEMVPVPEDASLMAAYGGPRLSMENRLRTMSNYTQIKFEINNKLAVITLNRPRKKNAINSTMYLELTDALEKLSENDDCTVTVITGTGDYYSSGTDLSDTMSKAEGSFQKTVEETFAKFRKFVEAFINHKKILIAIVNGPAIGIAVTTLALCDVVYCVDTATFHTPFTSLGNIPEGCSTYTFPRIMGPAKANEMLLFNKKITAKEACDSGLIAKVYTREEIDSVLWPQLREKASELPFKALMYSKQLLRKFDVEKLHEANRVECERLIERATSQDVMEGLMKFMSRKSKL